MTSQQSSFLRWGFGGVENGDIATAHHVLQKLFGGWPSLNDGTYKQWLLRRKANL